jgi:hypothetical protein
VALFTTRDGGCTRVWEAPVSTVGRCSRVVKAVGGLPGQRRGVPGERPWSCRKCRRPSCTRRSGGTIESA